MSMNNSSSAYHFGCRGLESNVLFSLINVVIIICCTFGVAANGLLIKYCVISKVLDLNSLLFFTNASLVEIGLAITVISQASYNIFVSIDGFQKVPSISGLLCMSSHAVWTLFNLALPCTFIFLGVERAYGTVKLHKNMSTIGYSAWLAPIAAWLIPLIFTSCQLIAFRNLPSVCYCDGLLMMTQSFFIVGSSAMYFILQFAIVVLFLYIYYTNRVTLLHFGINKAKSHSLTQRFQIWNNVKLTQLLFPSVILNVVCTIMLNCCVIVVHYVFRNEPDTESLNVSQLKNILATIYIVAHPLMVIYQRKQFRKRRNQTLNASTMLNEEQLGVAQMVAVTNQLLVEFRISPDHNAMILDQMWSTSEKQIEKCNRNKVTPLHLKRPTVLTATD